MTPVTTEQNTIGLGPVGAEHLERVMESGWFATELDACRVAMALALRRDLIATPAEMGTLTTKYNVGTYDRDGKVRGLLTALGTPANTSVYEHAERLLHAGLRVLADELAPEGAMLSDILAGEERKGTGSGTVG